MIIPDGIFEIDDVRVECSTSRFSTGFKATFTVYVPLDFDDKPWPACVAYSRLPDVKAIQVVYPGHMTLEQSHAMSKALTLAATWLVEQE